MIEMKKIISLALVFLMLFSVLVGCTNSEQGSTSKKKLVMATNAEFPPYEYKDGTCH